MVATCLPPAPNGGCAQSRRDSVGSEGHGLRRRSVSGESARRSTHLNVLEDTDGLRIPRPARQWPSGLVLTCASTDPPSFLLWWVTSPVYQVSPWAQMAYDLGQDLNAPHVANPRIFKTHQLLSAINVGCKYIVTVRYVRHSSYVG